MDRPACVVFLIVAQSCGTLMFHQVARCAALSYNFLHDESNEKEIISSGVMESSCMMILFKEDRKRISSESSNLFIRTVDRYCFSSWLK